MPAVRPQMSPLASFGPHKTSNASARTICTGVRVDSRWPVLLHALSAYATARTPSEMRVTFPRRRMTLAVLLGTGFRWGDPGARRSALGARRSALGARRSALGARRSALGARRSALGARRSALGARRSALGARRSALGARRSALGARRSALGARRSALGARRSALGARRSALGARQNCTPGPPLPRNVKDLELAFALGESRGVHRGGAHVPARLGSTNNCVGKIMHYCA